MIDLKRNLKNFGPLEVLVLGSLIYVVSTAFALADHKSGHAHVYKVTMRKVELCTASTPDKDNMTNAATCSNPVVIGSGDVLVDIASVEAGSVAASYGDPALFPLGETYTHMRVTIDRRMTVKGFATTGNGDTCRTQSAGGGANYPGGSLSGNEKYTHQAVVTEGVGVGITEQDVYMVNDDYVCVSNQQDFAVEHQSPSLATFAGSTSTKFF